VTWRLALHHPAARAEPPRPGLLYGILRCATCRAYLTMWSGRSDGIDRMYCCGRQLKQRGACPHRAWVTASTMDALAEDLLFAAARRRPQIARKTQTALLRAERKVAAAEQRFVRYRDNDRLLEVLDQDQYLGGLEVRAEAVREATATSNTSAPRASASTPYASAGSSGAGPPWTSSSAAARWRRSLTPSFSNPDTATPSSASGSANAAKRPQVCRCEGGPSRHERSRSRPPRRRSRATAPHHGRPPLRLGRWRD
jgi:hypothetical protein